ncbi:uncharacterized protein LOC105664524 [Ceratitis capitata]|uniref:uncharacterized protein LOC105664524 n=1 Tax=Ceratitis capitata TaxID=7213 RepID=UPI000A109F47|nr:uncharacterized protein LOC105664524 [Ceratitis capitata]
MPVVKINTLKLTDLKEILSERGLSTEGFKNKLVLRLSEAVGSDGIEIANVNLQAQITELRDMFSSVLQMLQTNNNVSELNERGGQERISTPADSSPTIHGRSNYSVKEIAETIPDFDPTNDSSISVEQFVDRIKRTRKYLSNSIPATYYAKRYISSDITINSIKISGKHNGRPKCMSTY